MLTIEAEPFPFQFEPRTTALVVIDMQRDFIEPGGFGESLGNDVSRLAAIVPTVARLIAGCRDAGVTVIYTKECHRPDLPIVRPPSAVGAILHPASATRVRWAGC
jgi:nicotinamidase-related amidase